MESLPSGGSGYGVENFIRFVIILPSASSTAPLIPLPPMSMARVVGGWTLMARKGSARASETPPMERGPTYVDGLLAFLPPRSTTKGRSVS